MVAGNWKAIWETLKPHVTDTQIDETLYRIQLHNGRTYEGRMIHFNSEIIELKVNGDWGSTEFPANKIKSFEIIDTNQ